MPRSVQTVPLALVPLNFLAVILSAAGGLRLLVPGVEILQRLPESAAWASLALGLACLAVFWAVLIRHLRLQRGAG